MLPNMRNNTKWSSHFGESTSFMHVHHQALLNNMPVSRREHSEVTSADSRKACSPRMCLAERVRDVRTCLMCSATPTAKV